MKRIPTIAIRIPTIAIAILTAVWPVSQGLKAQQNPCSSEKAHQFDFWTGEWEVFKFGTDTLVGHNTITPIADGCALLEDWRGASGSIGSSINKYNFSTGLWEQMWVDNSGATLHIQGSYGHSKMVLENEQPERNGKGIIKNKITFYNNEDGTVRQHWEYSRDNGKTWATVFDGLYRKVKNH